MSHHSRPAQELRALLRDLTARPLPGGPCLDEHAHERLLALHEEAEEKPWRPARTLHPRRMR